jgi:hypothetical protein
MSTTMTTASLTVTAGPDRGQTFALTDEFVHIGSGADSQVLLTDPQAVEHLASLANRNGRYAIFTPIENAISVDGNALKADQWVWLPDQATIKVTAKTTLTFATGANGAAANTSSNSATSTPIDLKLSTVAPSTASSFKASAPEKRRTAKKGESTTTRRAVAKFITDRPGETLVRLGEDGQLPELALQEVAAPKVDKRKTTSQGNPALVYGALGFSLLASVAMLFVDPPVMDERSTSKAEARKDIVSRFIGDEKGPTTACQRLLREAGLAYSRGDYNGERSAYLNVLSLLNAEDKNPYTGITGSPATDEDLKEDMAVLLAR